MVLNLQQKQMHHWKEQESLVWKQHGHFAFSFLYVIPTFEEHGNTYERVCMPHTQTNRNTYNTQPCPATFDSPACAAPGPPARRRGGPRRPCCRGRSRADLRPLPSKNHPRPSLRKSSGEWELVMNGKVKVKAHARYYGTLMVCPSLKGSSSSQASGLGDMEGGS